MSELQTAALLNDRYLIKGRLGTGGMGEVYLGLDTHRRKSVAIKCMRGELERSSNEMFLRRFREEVDILRRLNFPGVPAFVDAFEWEGHSILVMEFIEGHSLEQLLRRSREDGKGGLPTSLVVRMGIEVCQILQCLHTFNPPMIHRDIKPGNIIIRTVDERVFLVDFGLARELRSQSSLKTMVGTAEYAPVEQFQGRPEARSDLYALGVTMHELLTAVPPTPLAIPPIQQLRPDLHEDLVRIINRATRPGVEERYPDAGDMRMLLEDVLPRLGTEIAASPKPVAEAEDKVEELIRRWGRGKTQTPVQEVTTPQWDATSHSYKVGNSATQQRPMAQPIVTEAAPLDDPVLRRNVQRAGERAQRFYSPRRGVPILLVLLLLVGGVLATGYWNQKQSKEIQHPDALGELSLGEGWRLVEALGLFPAEGVGLGNSDLGPRRGGFLYQSSSTQPLHGLSLRLRHLQGGPRVLVLASPWGILLEPRQDKYDARLVSVDSANSLSAISTQVRPNLPKLTGPLSQVRLTLTFNGGKGTFQIESKSANFVVESTVPLRYCGVVLLESPKNSRCAVSDWKFL